MKDTIYDMRFRSAGLIDIQELDSTIVAELKYATLNNFTGELLYDENFGIYAEPRLAQAIADVNARLHEVRPDYNLVVYDAARPMSTQRHMFEMVRDTPYERYIANPYGNYPGGFHNYGMAVDMSISDENGKPLDMATEFDSFTELAHVGNEYNLLSEGKMTMEQYKNRMLLYWLTSASGLLPHPYEWWHYQLDVTEESKNNFKLLDF